jgi:hypothetical protein
VLRTTTPGAGETTSVTGLSCGSVNFSGVGVCGLR